MLVKLGEEQVANTHIRFGMGKYPHTLPNDLQNAGIFLPVEDVFPAKGGTTQTFDQELLPNLGTAAGGTGAGSSR